MKKIFLLLITFFLSLSSLASSDSTWVMVRIPVACIRADRSHSSEMTSQAILGTPLLVKGSPDAEWLSIESPDGYKGYMISTSVTPLTHKQMTQWRKAPRVVVTAGQEVIVTDSGGARVSELVAGSIVEGTLTDGDSIISVTLPDGRKGSAPASRFSEISRWADQPFNADRILASARALMGAPYLWGGMSTKGVDCSGLVRVAYFDSGIILRRDASQQIHTGIKIPASDPGSLRKADLLFFSYVPGGRISHVGLYDTDGVYFHSSGLVKENRMATDDPDFSHRIYRGASRIDGAIPSDGITRVINHPWYFK